MLSAPSICFQRRKLIIALPLLALGFFPLCGAAQTTLAEVQAADPAVLYRWDFQGEEGGEVATAEDSGGTLPLERVQPETDESVFAVLGEIAPGGGRSLQLPAPSSPENGGWLRTKSFDWPEEGTVEFLIKPSSDGPLESGQALSGLSVGNRWYVYQEESGRPLQWWVGGSNSRREARPDLLGGASPVHLQDGTWYYVVLQYRFDTATSTCDLKAFVAALDSDEPKLEAVADTRVEASGPSDEPPLRSRLNVGGEANGQGSRWYGSLANIAISNGWLDDDGISARLKTLRK